MSTSPSVPFGPYRVQSYADFLRAVDRYRPSDVIRFCHRYSLALVEAGQNAGRQILRILINEGPVSRHIVTAPYAIALIARASLLRGSELAPGSLNEERFQRLLAMVADLYEPSSPHSLLLQTGYEQGWYQENIRRTLGRAMLMYVEIPSSLTADFDFGRQFERMAGLTIQEFLGLSFVVYSKMAAADGAAIFLTTVRPRGLPEPIEALWTPDRLTSFLNICGTNVSGFRAIALHHAGDAAADGGRYSFNPLLSRPIIDLGVSGHTAPIPDLIIFRAEWAPYWDLRDATRGDGAENAFANFFGKEIFESYIGRQLRSAFPSARLLAESQAAYQTGSGEQRGPDWIAVEGTVGVAVECTIASIPLAAKADGDLEAASAALSRGYAGRMNKLPDKVRSLIVNRPDLGLSQVQDWHHVLVYKESVAFLETLRPELLDPHLTPEGKSVHLLSVADFETLVAMESTVGFASLIRESESNPERPVRDFRSFLHQISTSRSIGARNDLLHDAQRRLLDGLGVD